MVGERTVVMIGRVVRTPLDRYCLHEVRVERPIVIGFGLGKVVTDIVIEQVLGRVLVILASDVANDIFGCYLLDRCVVVEIVFLQDIDNLLSLINHDDTAGEVLEHGEEFVDADIRQHLGILWSVVTVDNDKFAKCRVIEEEIATHGVTERFHDSSNYGVQVWLRAENDIWSEAYTSWFCPDIIVQDMLVVIPYFKSCA